MMLKYAILNGALESLPQPIATMAIIPLQMKRVYRIGRLYGYALDRGHIREFLGVVGVGMTSQVVETFARRLLTGFAKKVLGKIGGHVADVAAGSAYSFTSTYALGQPAEIPPHCAAPRESRPPYTGCASLLLEPPRDGLGFGRLGTGKAQSAVTRGRFRVASSGGGANGR
jgi:uncharacterized protein (DUF697 family)